MKISPGKPALTVDKLAHNKAEVKKNLLVGASMPIL
jgi:hypothetical protein